MRRIVIAGLALMALSVLSCKENVAAKIKKENLQVAKERDYKMGDGAAVITFDKKEHDFGTINEGDVVETTFSFKNTGKSELIITNATAPCGCTVPSWPKEPIAVGETGEILVKFNSNGKPNKQSKTVTLTTNTAAGKEQVVIKAEVTPKAKKANS
ncbi:MAG: DUF1573 domain-containing protein [Flavobacteriaceae bacterium]|nr:DUF1573 domain-containing protein [Flavobacteriaceae bacterium]